MYIHTEYFSNIFSLFFQEFCNSGSIVEFEELRKFAVVRQKLIVRPEELILPTFDIKTKNLPRENFDKQLDAIAAKGCMIF